MPFKPLVSKIRVHNPNKKGSAIANRNYLTYIATREGVALDGVKDINDLLKKDGLMELDLDENIIHVEANNSEYLEYMARRPRSHGLFGNIDTDNLEALASRVSDLTKSGKIIYRGVISLSQEDGETLGYKTTDAWYNYMKRVMPDIAKELGISITDHTWIAAFHAEEIHPHVHYELWDNKDRVRSPYIHVSVQKRCRELLSNEMFDNSYENMIKEIHQVELNELKKTRNEERTKILDLSKNVFQNIGYVPGIEYETLPRKIKNDDLKSVAEDINQLIPLLPESGRLNYKFLPLEAKEQINKISDKLFQKFDIRQGLENYLSTVEKMHQFYGETKTEISRAVEDAEKDIRSRVNNRILKEIKSSILEIGNPHIVDQISSKVADSLCEKDIKEQVSQGRDELPEKLLDGYVNSFTDNYYIEWNEEYKKSMDLIYLIYGSDTDYELAFNILEEQAVRGNAIAISEVAKFIDKGILESLDQNEAVEFYNKSLKAFKCIYENDEDEYHKRYAAYRIGKIYDSGKGSDKGIDFKEAEKWYMAAGENKHAEYSLGKLYLDNKVILSEENDLKINYKAAYKLFTSSANNDNPYAAYELGNMYTKGIGVEVDLEKASFYYSKAFAKFLSMSNKNTNDNLLYRIGKMLQDGKGTEKDENRAIKYFEKAAKLGNENAQYALADIYIKSGNQEKAESAIKMLEKLAENNNNMALYRLGTLFLDPESVRYSIEKAVGYLEKSAEQENQFAQYKLGAIFTDKESSYYDMVKAMEYLNKSEEQGNQFAQYKLGAIYADYDMVKAMEYLRKSAEQKNQYAQYKLGTIHMNPELGYYDMEKALDYLQKSAEQESQYAQYKLGAIHADAESGYHNIGKAMEYLRKSAEQENQFAQYKLGAIHSDAESGYYNIGKAVEYLRKSAEQGNQFAQYKLGCIYYFGKGVKKDLQEGKYWLEKSAEQGNQFANDILSGVEINFAYYLVKGILQNIEEECRRMDAINHDNLIRTHSKQAIREYFNKRDGEQKKQTEFDNEQ